LYAGRYQTFGAIDKKMTHSDAPTILVADDNPDDRKLMRGLLESCCGCIVVEAENGVWAVELARSGRPDMIIMNLMMPKLDGYEAARLIRRDPSLVSSQMIAYSTYYVVP
jgi:CheY-like chemotaxis protein